MKESDDLFIENDGYTSSLTNTLYSLEKEIQHKYTKYNSRELESDQQKKINFITNELNLFDSLNMCLNLHIILSIFMDLSIWEKINHYN